MARDIDARNQPQSSNWVSTRIVREVQGPRFHCFGQCHPIYIKRIQEILENVPSGAHNNCPLPSKKQRPSRTVSGYFQESYKTIQRWIHGGSITTVTTSIWLTPNKNALLVMTPAEIMFAQKIRPVFNKLIPNKKKVDHTVQKNWK